MEPSQGELIVALFDVLGFEDRVGSLPLHEVYEQYKGLLSIATSKGSHAFLDARPDGGGGMVPFLGYVAIDHDYFSDTILVWTKFAPHTLTPFLRVCGTLMCEALQAELPLRGALALGEAIMEKPSRTYLGQPLVEAARAEKAQQWIGLAFGPSFDGRRDVPFRADLVRPYTKHRKPGQAALLPGLVLDWPRLWREEYKTSAVPALERLAALGRMTEYYKVAIEFVAESDANPEWWKSYSDGGLPE